MTRYVAFLRAVNVGKRIIKMEELRQQLITAGYKNVSTYIQSGNIMFTASGQATTLSRKMEQLLLRTYGFEVPVIIRSVTELEKSTGVYYFPVGAGGPSCGGSHRLAPIGRRNASYAWYGSIYLDPERPGNKAPRCGSPAGKKAGGTLHHPQLGYGE